MELMPGYKASEIGPIPEDWDAVPLAELGEALIGLTYAPKDVSNDGTLVLRSSNIQNDALAFTDNVYVTCPVPEKIMVRPGDVLICVRNGSADLIGKTALLDERVIGMTFGAFMAVFRSEIGPLVNYCFQSPILKRQINEHLGATINQITNKSLNSFRIPLPRKKEEQRAIAEALADVDAAIEAMTELLAKKRGLRTAAMQRLLTGVTRLPGFTAPWQKMRLGEIGRFLKGSGVRRDQAGSGNLPCVRYGELYTTHGDTVERYSTFISASVAEGATRVQFRDILFAASGETKAEIGRCSAIVSEAEAYAGGDIVILRPTSGNPWFLGSLFNSSAVARQKATRGQGDAVVHINARELATIAVLMPEENEQDAIADVIKDLSKEVSALEIRLTKLVALKQAMMQALLTGRVRLPLADVQRADKEPSHA